MSARILQPASASESLQKHLRGLPASTLLVVDDRCDWLPLLRKDVPPLKWSVLQVRPQDPWQQHPQLRGGGWLWQPGQEPSPRSTPPKGTRWRPLPSPWSQLARWNLQGLPLRGRHVTLLAPPTLGLEGLVNWLPRQGASFSRAYEDARVLENLLRLSDIVVLFPGLDLVLEAHQAVPGVTWVDLRPDPPGPAQQALELVCGAYTDRSRGALEPLLICLALAQQETLMELA